MSLLKDLQGLNAAYAEMQQKEAYTVTAADKKGNTPAYQGLKAGKKNVKTGEPLYKAADHLKKEDRESKLWDEVAKMLTELHELRGVQYKVVPLEEKKAAKDYDGDGKIESGKDEYFGSKDKAIKKAMGKKVKEEEEVSDETKKLIESGKFTQEEIDAIVEADRLGKIDEARRADKMGIARKKVTYDKGEETRNPNPDRGATSLHKPAGSSLAGSKAASRARSLGDARRKANRKGANLAYGDREGRLSNFAATKRQSDADLGAQKAATDTGAHKDKKTGYRQDAKYGKRGDMRRPSYNPKHTANK